ncbi:hypothetical protein HII31_00461 [Pseudocercospora fuligena]|uniref:NadR/Ttd14 AAA domain-containing protein n=1 Tax=Pseudocercospora fuligena TaxID=685502 RepID=A0A8H6RUH5_9PEZI|nr:hypothetical protein HII31_00461 [Pseudocercospora fuligena]
MAVDEIPNIYIIGASSTGKTTLVNALHEHYSQQTDLSPPAVVAETARPILHKFSFRREDYFGSPDKTSKLQSAILEAQCRAEKSQNTWYISDRSAIDPIVYSRIFVGDADVDVQKASASWKALEPRMRAGTVLLCEAPSPWLDDDGIRWVPSAAEDWVLHDAMFRKELSNAGLEYKIVPKEVTDIKDRVKIAVEAHACKLAELDQARKKQSKVVVYLQSCTSL